MPKTVPKSEERIYIREAAERLNRKMGTLRKWDQQNVLPVHLRPRRGYRGWRYWTPEQLDQIRVWAKTPARLPGRGLPHYNPTEQELDAAIAAMRKPRKRRAVARSVRSSR